MEFWKNGLLPFDPVNITANYLVGEDETEHPDFERVMLRKSAKYHHNCHIRYSPYNLARKKKSLRSKNKKAEVGQSSAFLRSSMGSNSRGSSSSAIPNPICIVCGEHDAIENVHAAEAFHASKSKLNSEHVMKLTNNWRDIAVYIGDNALVNRLMIGDLGANSSFYHKRCSTNLYNGFTKKQKEECKGKIGIDHVKAAAWDKVIAFMIETFEGFDLHDLENIYLDYLSEYEIFVESHITRFSEKLIERAYEVMKMDEKQRVFRKDSMHEMFSIFLKALRSWTQSLRTIVQPIRYDIFKHKNSFDGNLMDNKQDKVISPFLLSLTNMLVDGEINIEGKC